MITREDMIEQSVTDFARAALTERGYMSVVEIVDSFQGIPRPDPLKTNYIAIGFNFDDEPEQAECGSDLVKRTYSHQFFVFGLSATFARNIAQALKFGLERDARIPIKDISQESQPVIDYLVDPVATAERQIVPDPEPWQQFVWTTTLRVEDEYHASLV